MKKIAMNNKNSVTEKTKSWWFKIFQNWMLSDNEKLTSRFGNDYVKQNDHRESGLYNRFHQRNREIIFRVIHKGYEKQNDKKPTINRSRRHYAPSSPW
jgi:hypothetical protein